MDDFKVRQVKTRYRTHVEINVKYDTMPLTYQGTARLPRNELSE